MKKIYIIAGEPSGDLHGAHLVDAIKKIDPEFVFRGFGGPKMENVGVQLDQTIDKLSFMGFAEVVKHLPRIMANFRIAKSAIRTWNPDAIIYVDFPGFNMRIARWARKNGFNNYYYIAPQAWAWKEKRALKLKRDVGDVFSILPFEKSFFERFGLEVHYVGHPLVDIVREYREMLPTDINPDFQTRHLSRSPHFDSNSPPSSVRRIIALLPGSREQEVAKIFPCQLEAVKDVDNFDVVIGKSPHVARAVYDQIIEQVAPAHPNIILEEGTYSLLSKAYLAFVASGTATLETALFRVPQVVCFRGSDLSYRIARKLIKVPYISLVNLVMNDEVVKELIQDELTASHLQREMYKLMDQSVRDRMIHQYKLLEKKLGLGGAAEKTAKIIIQNIGKKINS